MTDENTSGLGVKPAMGADADVPLPDKLKLTDGAVPGPTSVTSTLPVAL